MGRHTVRLLKFAIRYPGWHSMQRSDRAAIRAMERLYGYDLLDVIRYGVGINPQFRLHVNEDDS